ncbi:hypothetical protein CR158_05440 [Halomonas heilongjiangensis]|uniref:Uncharacterized protein n=1 Tax=Halomonas heilongjiangensis TaxID=1387883 RepID=A0A2N7TJF8_9GAMM|nr:hypothetical protein C1H66_15730 [Halomonas heilongjiangensis]PXX93128.1 hypothetical protein CR158_05440 [Halomonas heilongjiangensis]
MDRITYYALKPWLPVHAPSPVFEQDEKNELFIGPHVRLAGLPGMAHIDTEQLANAYAEAVRPVLQRRYGSESDVQVIAVQAGGEKAVKDRIRRDSAIVRKRLATGNMSPNKAV